MTIDPAPSQLAPSGTLAGTAQAPPHGWSESPLGQILVGLGTVDVVDVMLAAYEQDLGDGRRIGEILMSRGLATRADIELALLDQSRTTAVPTPSDSSPQTAVAIRPSTSPVVAPAAVGLPEGTAFPRRQGPALRLLQAVVMVALLATAVLLLGTSVGGPAFGVALYATLSVPYLLAKLALSLRYRATSGEVPVGTAVSVVVPFLNEDASTFRRCLTALTQQTLPPAQIFVIDDGSTTRECYDVALAMAAEHPTISVHRFPENRGKREAQAWAFGQVGSDIVVTVDSDTVVHHEAFAELVKPFADPRVNAVCGYARALNRRTNLLTRLIDLRYTNSFLYERGAYSVVGSVLCSTGVLSAWRRHVVLDNEADYLNQEFMGNTVHYGDDRRLTAYALRTGRVVLQDTALALTNVPERMPHFVRQQIRWNKSFFRESLLLLRQMRPTRIAWWLGAAEFGYWMVLTTMLLYSLAVRPAIEGVFPSWQTAAFVALMAYARSIRMIGDGGRLLPVAFLMAPVYGFMNILLLVPLRVYSLMRLRDGSWGTRKRRRGIRRAKTVVAGVGAVDTTVPRAVVPAQPLVPAPAVLPVQRQGATPAPVPVSAAMVTGRPCLNILPAK